MAEEVDVIVIGLGPGGENAAGLLASEGLQVVGIEGRLVGGECPYWGCIPSKMMIRASDALAEARRVPSLAGSVSDVRPDWSLVARRIREEATDTWDDKVAVERLAGKGARVVRGYGKVTAPGEVTVGSQVFRARRGIILSAGTSPVIPPLEGLSGTPYWTNHEAIETESVPSSLIVLGGGAIGVELAQVFSRFGSEVTVVEAGPRLVALEEPESGDLLCEMFGREGISVHAGVKAQSVRHDPYGFTLSLADGKSVTGEKLLVATGRRTDLPALGVGVLGVDESARFVPVDERLRVAEGVWALGDLTGKGAFTHVSMYQSEIVVREILGQPGPAADYRALPRVTFTDPEVGAVGLTEKQARSQGIEVSTAFVKLPEVTRGWIQRADGFIKLVADTSRGVLVGATTAGPAGGEIMGALTVAVAAEVPISRLRHMIYAYPTLHRGILQAVTSLDLP
jgi:pyruvate/2-oxoglutarate dehydrogenase complex dihydrolipoamide dehydrogenase (E3) component